MTGEPTYPCQKCGAPCVRDELYAGVSENGVGRCFEHLLGLCLECWNAVSAARIRARQEVE